MHLNQMYIFFFYYYFLYIYIFFKKNSRGLESAHLSLKKSCGKRTTSKVIIRPQNNKVFVAISWLTKVQCLYIRIKDVGLTLH